MANDLEGRVAVVTGGARGFGKAFGAALAERGATVALLDLDATAVQEAANELGDRVFACAADVTHEARIAAVIDEIAAAHGGIDILINNAGLHSAEYSRPIEAMGLAKVRRLFDVNVMGTIACTLAAMPHMQGRTDANILNISSSAAFGGGSYGASKMAVISMTITFARELAAKGIRVNAIAPGLILTDTIRAELPAETLARVKGAQFLTTAEGEERDIVEAMLYLTSDRARFITGETLRVSGGFAAGA
ncbi:short-chain dehydrogenase/reductase SDR [Sphingomonas sp. LH128]|uniref:SDR family NAD(P)-dependent oxidoreductase n=1 Tax=Sphingomonas sp. LH128 TaxID=473781 RepID=UPI00027CC758|nr:SDR family oxidoreductase [Sphingomonas sp. LH128]EJU13641.1 short-chain dehydrogenase/reductase SDR [Sphingomonas sp. LH128]